LSARRKATTQISRLAHRASGTAAANRMVPEETPVAPVRGDDFDIFTHPDRVVSGVAKHVA
jgi:hypothetical protein